MTELADLKEAVSFLLKGFRSLNDRCRELEELSGQAQSTIERSFGFVRADVDDVAGSIQNYDERLLEIEDAVRLLGNSDTHSPRLPVQSGTDDRQVPLVNLPLEKVLEVYAETPVLLGPFSRPCTLSERTITGEISGVELKIAAHGAYWVMELPEKSWLLFPKPGVLERSVQLQSLERLFTVEGNVRLPAELLLIEPAQVEAIEHGRRWILREPGQLIIGADHTQTSVVLRISLIEDRLQRLEGGTT
jgi:hypothetical protein